MTAVFDDHGTSPPTELPPQQSTTGAFGSMDIPPDDQHKSAGLEHRKKALHDVIKTGNTVR